MKQILASFDLGWNMTWTCSSPDYSFAKVCHENQQTTTFSFEGINQRGITQKQDKGLSWDFPAILVEFSPDSVAWKQTKLS